MTLAVVILIIGMAASVYLPKLVPFLLLDEVSARHRWIDRVVRQLAPAVLGAIAGPAAVLSGGHLHLSASVGFGYAVALAVAVIRRDIVTPMLAGMATLVILRFVVPSLS